MQTPAANFDNTLPFLKAVNAVFYFLEKEEHILLIRNTCQCRRCLECENCPMETQYGVKQGRLSVNVAEEMGSLRLRINKPAGRQFISKHQRLAIYAQLLTEEADLDAVYWMAYIDPPFPGDSALNEWSPENWKLTLRNPSTNERICFPCEAAPEIVNMGSPDDPFWELECKFRLFVQDGKYNTGVFMSV